MTNEERGDFRYMIFVEQAPGWVPAWPQPEFETESGAIMAARQLRDQGENAIVEKYAATGAYVGEVFL